MGLKTKKWLTNSQIELRETRAPRKTPSRRFQALGGEHAQRRTQLTPESHHPINTYYAFIDKVPSELKLRFSGMIWEISVTVKHLYMVEHRTGIAEVTGSNPVEALIFSGFFFPIAQIGKLTAMIILHFRYRSCH